MPNHTPNTLTILGVKNIKKLLRPYLTLSKDNFTGKKDYALDLGKIVPMPKEILASTKYGNLKYLNKKRTPQQEKRMRERQEKHEKKCLELYGAKNWYDWSISYWGTKWNTYENSWFTDENTGVQCLYFQTAWAPPEPALRELAIKLGKILRVSYMDEGYAFFGVFHFYPDGNVEDECYQDHKDVPEKLCEELGINTYEEDRLEQEEEGKEEQKEQVELAQKG